MCMITWDLTSDCHHPLVSQSFLFSFSFCKHSSSVWSHLICVMVSFVCLPLCLLSSFPYQLFNLYSRWIRMLTSSSAVKPFFCASFKTTLNTLSGSRTFFIWFILIGDWQIGACCISPSSPTDAGMKICFDTTGGQVRPGLPAGLVRDMEKRRRCICLGLRQCSPFWYVCSSYSPWYFYVWAWTHVCVWDHAGTPFNFLELLGHYSGNLRIDLCLGHSEQHLQIFCILGVWVLWSCRSDDVFYSISSLPLPRCQELWS